MFSPPRLRPIPLLLLAAALGLGPALAQAPAHPRDSAGPGVLFIVGGGRQPPGLLERFVALAGGPGTARIAVVPLASSDPAASGGGKVEQLTEHGASAFVLLSSAAEAHQPAVVTSPGSPARCRGRRCWTGSGSGTRPGSPWAAPPQERPSCLHG